MAILRFIDQIATVIDNGNLTLSYKRFVYSFCKFVTIILSSLFYYISYFYTASEAVVMIGL